MDLAENINGLSLSDGNNERRHAHWQTMLNANDQLRQKMGFALQQIVVASASMSAIENNAYGAANYQDMLNTHAFAHYRDVLGYVNWSPIMGKWLSSLQNQTAIDFDGDGLFDTYPDENLARVNMQLFHSAYLNLAGWQPQLSPTGLPSPPTRMTTSRNLRILTGQSCTYTSNNTEPTWAASLCRRQYEFDRINVPMAPGHILSCPMKMFGEYHSLGAKSVARPSTTAGSPTHSRGHRRYRSSTDAGHTRDGQPTTTRCTAM